MTIQKRPAIVQCSLGDMRQPITKTSAPKRHEPAHILLRLNAPAAAPNGFDLVLDIGQPDLQVLRSTLERIAERYHIIALLPPNGVSFAAQEAGRMIALIAEECQLPGFGSGALALASNRFLTRCHWQQARLPTSKFSLVQFPSALALAAATIGYPAQLSPLLYTLPHLFARINRESELAKAHQLVSRVMNRYALNHPLTPFSDGCDPRTGHHIRFSPVTDMLFSAAKQSTTCALTVISRDGNPGVLACKAPPLRKADVHTLCELATQACTTLGMRSGVATCIVSHGPAGNFLEGLMPHYMDPRLLPTLGKKVAAIYLAQ